MEQSLTPQQSKVYFKLVGIAGKCKDKQIQTAIWQAVNAFDNSIRYGDTVINKYGEFLLDKSIEK